MRNDGGGNKAKEEGGPRITGKGKTYPEIMRVKPTVGFEMKKTSARMRTVL
jgi:hypothetical protein